MEIEISHAMQQDRQQHTQFAVPSFSSEEKIVAQGTSINHTATVPMEVHSVQNDRQHAPFPSVTCENQVFSEGESSIVHDFIASSNLVTPVIHASQHKSLQLDNYDDSLINALDLGLVPIDDEKESRLNKSMDVSTFTSFLCYM